MNQQTKCPQRGRLRGLLDDSAAPEEQGELVGHLDSCECCQNALEEMAGGSMTIPPDLATPLPDEPAATSAFWPALQQVRQEAPATRTGTATASAEELSLDFLQPTETPGRLGTMGRFEVIQLIGRGGMGVVFKAFDTYLEREVALKVLDPQVAGNETAQRRFCREARSAASVTHENVVAIHQVDEDEASGLPYLVMQLVPGVSLQERLDREGPLPLAEIIRIGRQIAYGLAAAHKQGLIHRDIKPANVLLANGVDQVKLTDFGLARVAEDVKLTQTGFIAGTPLYMAPEQARGEPLDHRADLFSFGSVLYAMCTGKPPFGGSTPFVVLKNVTEEIPPPVETVNPAIPAWLGEIIERLQAKNPADRYQSADEVGKIFCHHYALLYSCNAPAPSTGRTRSLRSRPRWLLPTLVASVVGFATLSAFLAAEVGGLTHVFPAAQPRGNPIAEEDGPRPEATVDVNTGPIWSVALGADNNTLALAIDDGTVKLWDVKAGRVRATLNAHAGPVWSVALSQEGDLMATASDDGTVKVWDRATGDEPKTLEHLTAVRTVAFSPTGKSLVTGTRNGNLRIWDLDAGVDWHIPKAHAGLVMSVAYSPDGQTVASAGSDKVVKLWDAATRREQVTLRGHTGSVYAVAFSPDGKTLATGSWDKTVRLWNAATGNQTAVLTGHSQDVWAVAFSPDGQTLASASEDRTVKLWNVARGTELATYKGHTGTLYAVAFSRDGRTIVSGGRDGTARLWNARPDTREEPRTN